MSEVTFVQDGCAHRPYRSDGERISLACRPEGSQPVDLFDVVLLETVGPLRRCVNCYLDSDMLTTVCDRHSTWGRVGESASCQQCADDPKVVLQGQSDGLSDPLQWERIVREAAGQAVPWSRQRGASLEIKLSDKEMMSYRDFLIGHWVRPDVTGTYITDVTGT
jgi:hypothetical protein